MAVTKIVRSAVLSLWLALLRGLWTKLRSGRPVQSGLTVSQLHTGMKTTTAR